MSEDLRKALDSIKRSTARMQAVTNELKTMSKSMADNTKESERYRVQSLLQGQLDQRLRAILDDVRAQADDMGFSCEIPEADNAFNTVHVQVILTHKAQQ